MRTRALRSVAAADRGGCANASALVPERYRDALSALIPAPSSELVSVSSAAGRVLACPVRAERSLPSFDNSAMDGFAVSASIVEQLRHGPTRVRILEEVAAGSAPSGRVSGFSAHQIMTGAPVAEGVAAVIRVEDTSGFAGLGAWVELYQPVRPGANIRRAGEDIPQGEWLFAPGHKLTPARVATLAAMGKEKVEVVAPLRVLVVSSGAELLQPGSAEAGPGHIYDSNAAMLVAQCVEAGCLARALQVASDDELAFSRQVDPHLGSIDLLLTSGGVSAGTHEGIRLALDGAVNFQHVGMRPGGPQGYGRYRGVPVVCFPGNPISAFVSFVALLEPALRSRHAMPPRQKTRVRVADADLAHSAAWTFQMTRLAGEGLVELVGSSRSASMAALAYADHLLIIPPGPETSPGTTFDAWAL